MAVFQQTGRKKQMDLFCAARNYVGGLWSTELLVLSAHIGTGFLITGAVKV
jgi:hypothetical protein